MSLNRNLSTSEGEPNSPSLSIEKPSSPTDSGQRHEALELLLSKMDSINDFLRHLEIWENIWIWTEELQKLVDSKFLEELWEEKKTDLLWANMKIEEQIHDVTTTILDINKESNRHVQLKKLMNSSFSFFKILLRKKLVKATDEFISTHWYPWAITKEKLDELIAELNTYNSTLKKRLIELNAEFEKNRLFLNQFTYVDEKSVRITETWIESLPESQSISRLKKMIEKMGFFTFSSSTDQKKHAFQFMQLTKDHEENTELYFELLKHISEKIYGLSFWKFSNKRTLELQFLSLAWWNPQKVDEYISKFFEIHTKLQSLFFPWSTEKIFFTFQILSQVVENAGNADEYIVKLNEITNKLQRHIPHSQKDRMNIAWKIFLQSTPSFEKVDENIERYVALKDQVKPLIPWSMNEQNYLALKMLRLTQDQPWETQEKIQMLKWIHEKLGSWSAISAKDRVNIAYQILGLPSFQREKVDEVIALLKDLESGLKKYSFTKSNDRVNMAFSLLRMTRLTPEKIPSYLFLLRRIHAKMYTLSFSTDSDKMMMWFKILTYILGQNRKKVLTLIQQARCQRDVSSEINADISHQDAWTFPEVSSMWTFFALMMLDILENGELVWLSDQDWEGDFSYEDTFLNADDTSVFGDYESSWTIDNSGDGDGWGGASVWD